MNRHENNAPSGDDAYDDARGDGPLPRDDGPLPPDTVTAARAARFSALLDVAFADDIAVRNSAARMRPAVLHAATAAHTNAHRRRMLKAAVLLVAIGSVVAVPPVRAWVADQVRLISERVAGDAAPVAPPLPTPVPISSADADVRYAFDVTSAVLQVTLDAPAGSVEVVVQAEHVAQAAAEAVAAPGTEMLVQPGGLAISSAGATAASQFRISVPAGVAVVRVAHRGVVVDVRPGGVWRVP